MWKEGAVVMEVFVFSLVVSQSEGKWSFSLANRGRRLWWALNFPRCDEMKLKKACYVRVLVHMITNLVKRSQCYSSVDEGSKEVMTLG